LRAHFQRDDAALDCEPAGQFCGGIAGFPCPEPLHCVDDPNDDCDPARGGADCGGMCTCVENVLCVRGSTFDSSPKVCACVPDPSQDPCAAVRCKAGTHCEPSDDGAVCVSDGQHCGGIAGFPCPGSAKCVDDPNDDCDPARGGADCGGVCTCVENVLCIRGDVFDPSPKVCACVPAPEDPCAAVQCKAGMHCQVSDSDAVCLPDAPGCGGFVGTPCPGAGQCVDDSSDDCDPDRGGADCAGLCQCEALGLCVAGKVWDGAPSVCGCVPATNPCAATLCPTNTRCEVSDGGAVCVSNGKLTCGPTTCADGSVCCNASCGICTAPNKRRSLDRASLVTATWWQPTKLTSRHRHARLSGFELQIVAIR
jgi:hypothetical protein